MTVDANDPRFPAAVDMLRRTGLHEFQLRYSDDEEPTVWMAIGTWKVDRAGRPTKHGRHTRCEAAGGLTPLAAVIRLLDVVVDGGECAHCGRPTGVTVDWTDTMPLAELVCWQVYDPELQTFRRSCEGDEP